MRILLVEDEKRLADALEYMLKKSHCVVDVAYDGDTGLDLAESGIYDLIILDWMLPGFDGIEILESIRGQSIKTPVIMLTAKDTVSNRVEGLDSGADDYLVKPFAMDELLARVRAFSRRCGSILMDNNLTIGSLTLDTKSCEAKIQDSIIKLTVKETQLLELLIRNQDQVLTKEQILDKVWGYASDVEISNVELYIYYLRKKLHREAYGFQIQTVRGVGYSLKAEAYVS